MAFEPKEPQKELKYKELRIYSDKELNNYTDDELKKFKIKHDIPMCDDLEKARGRALWRMPSARPFTGGNWVMTG
jgi:hypothetical protein